MKEYWAINFEDYRLKTEQSFKTSKNSQSAFKLLFLIFFEIYHKDYYHINWLLEGYIME